MCDSKLIAAQTSGLQLSEPHEHDQVLLYTEAGQYAGDRMQQLSKSTAKVRQLSVYSVLVFLLTTIGLTWIMSMDSCSKITQLSHRLLAAPARCAQALQTLGTTSRLQVPTVCI